MLICLHFNPSLPHQVEHAAWFAHCFRGTEHKYIFTQDRTTPADIHIVSGPHYAKQQWIGHPNTIWLDRALHPDNQVKTGTWASEDYVSLGWLNDNGGRDFTEGTGRPPIEIKNNAGKSGRVFLADYDGPIEEADTIRLHPDQAKPSESLLDCLHNHKTAIGYNTTALVTAAIEGLEIECRSEQHILHQQNWRNLLPYADWHYSEIQRGDAWEHLRSQLNQPRNQ